MSADSGSLKGLVEIRGSFEYQFAVSSALLCSSLNVQLRATLLYRISCYIIHREPVCSLQPPIDVYE
jgi:hypothetical protein